MPARIHIFDRVGIGVKVVVERHRVGGVAAEGVVLGEPSGVRAVVARPQVVVAGLGVVLLAGKAECRRHGAGLSQQPSERRIGQVVDRRARRVAQRPRAAQCVGVEKACPVRTVLADEIEAVGVRRGAVRTGGLKHLRVGGHGVDQEVGAFAVDGFGDAVAEVVVGVCDLMLRRGRADKPVLRVVAVGDVAVAQQVARVVVGVDTVRIRNQPVVGIVKVGGRCARGDACRPVAHGVVFVLGNGIETVRIVRDHLRDQTVAFVVGVINGSAAFLHDAGTVAARIVGVVVSGEGQVRRIRMDDGRNPARQIVGVAGAGAVGVSRLRQIAHGVITVGRRAAFVRNADRAVQGVVAVGDGARRRLQLR